MGEEDKEDGKFCFPCHRLLKMAPCAHTTPKSLRLLLTKSYLPTEVLQFALLDSLLRLSLAHPKYADGVRRSLVLTEVLYTNRLQDAFQESKKGACRLESAPPP